MKSSKAKTRYYIYAIALLPMLLLLGSGIVMLNYHTGAPVESTVLGFDGHAWMLFHRVVAVISSVLILLHLSIKTDWLKRLFTFNIKGKFKVSNILIFVFFLLSFLTAFLSWLVFPDTNVAQLLRGIHNKLGLVLIVLFLLHLFNYYRHLIELTKKILLKNVGN